MENIFPNEQEKTTLLTQLNLLGAKKVIMIEPQPKFFQYASKNIVHNNLTNKIQMINSAVSGKAGSIKINYDKSDQNFQIPVDNNGVSIPVITLDDILTKHSESGLVLKMDCEGCEYDVINYSSDETIKQFDAILLEFHSGCLDLKKRLESCGFNVLILNSVHTLQNTFQGHLLAKKY